MVLLIASQICDDARGLLILWLLQYELLTGGESLGLLLVYHIYLFYVRGRLLQVEVYFLKVTLLLILFDD